MKAFLIDPLAKRITEVLSDGSLDSIYELTQCSMVEPIYINQARDVLLVDEEACWKDDLKPFIILNRSILGRGLVFGSYGDEFGEPVIHLDVLRSIVAFPD